MPAVLDAAGLQIQTLEEVFAELVTRARAAFGANVNTTLQSVLGNLLRIHAEFETVDQELLLSVWQSFDPDLAEGVSLDRIAALTGSRRRGAVQSLILAAQFNGTPATAIANGRRVRLVQTQSVWEVIGGPYVIGGGGTVVGIVQAQVAGPVAALATGTAGWQILDAVAGWASFQSNTDAVVGRLAESDKSFRQRRLLELFRPATGPLAAIRAAVAAVEGIDGVQVYQNLGLTTDADGIPGKSFNVVVDGTTYVDQEVRDAIFSRMPPGADAYGTDVTGTSTDVEGGVQPVNFDEVDYIDVWLRATLTTSTSEDVYPIEGDTAVEDAMLAYGAANNGIGRDVLPVAYVGAIMAAAVPGIDAILVERSLDGASWSSAKLSIGIRERARFDSTRTSVVRI